MELYDLPNGEGVLYGADRNYLAQRHGGLNLKTEINPKTGFRGFAGRTHT